LYVEPVAPEGVHESRTLHPSLVGAARVGGVNEGQVTASSQIPRPCVAARSFRFARLNSSWFTWTLGSCPLLIFVQVEPFHPASFT
jgi:hypothetical protein